MKILAIEKEVAGVKDDQFVPSLLKKEAARAWDLHQKGVIRELHFRQDWHGAVLILECADADEARKVLGTLPLVEENLITFDIMPLVAYSGFSRLFHEDFCDEPPH